MLGYPIPCFTRNVDHQLPWDVIANLEVSTTEVFQTKGEKKINSKAKEFYLRCFPPASIFYTKGNLNIGALAGFSCNQKAKAEKDSSCKADFCYLRALCIHPKISPVFRNE